MSMRLSMFAGLCLGAALQGFGQVNHSLPTELAAPGKPTIIPKEGLSVFGEGVAADWQGNIYSNEMGTSDRTMQLKVGADRSMPWREADDDPNGMWLDTQNRLVICQVNALVRIKAGASWDGKTDTLYKYPSGGQAFNDVTGDSKDNLYFTNFQGRTVFFRNGATGKVDTVLRNLNLPNGIEWDEERKVVYVNLNGDGKVAAYTVGPDFSLTGRRDFASVRGADGIVLDAQGNVYAVAFGDSVHVRSAAGQRLGIIPLSGSQLTNLAFGGTDFKTLYMITNQGLYKLPMNVTGYKTGNYSVSIRHAAISTNAKGRGGLEFKNGILVVSSEMSSGPIADIRGRAIPGIVADFKQLRQRF